MSEENKDKYTPILPYDPTKRDVFPSYENTTYVRDLNIMPENPVRTVSNNMVKYYTTASAEPVKIGGDTVDSQNTEE